MSIKQKIEKHVNNEEQYHKTKGLLKSSGCFLFSLLFAIIRTIEHDMHFSIVLYSFSFCSLCCFILYMFCPKRKLISLVFGGIYTLFCISLITINDYATALTYAILPALTMTIFPFKYALLVNILLTCYALGFQVSNILLATSASAYALHFINIYIASFIISFCVDFFSHIKTIRLQSSINKIDTISKTDLLTQIPNRYSFNNYFDSFVDRENAEYCIIMMDIDKFKDYNDYYGHIIADEVLKNVALALKNACDTSDKMVARWGGEEFIVLLKNGTLEQGLKFGEELRQTIEDLNIPHRGLGENKIITISVGVAHQSEKHAYDKTLSEADKALYLAKTTGRNRVEHL